jgi:hypothetical protein
VLGVNQPLGASRRRWEFVSWWYTLILVAALLGIAGTFAYQRISTSPLQGIVLDAYSGEPVAGATILAGDHEARSDSDGRFGMNFQGATRITVRKSDYDPVTVSLPSSTQDLQDLKVKIRPNDVHGTVTARDSNEPIASATVQAKSGAETVSSTRVDQDGEFVLRGVPVGATLLISAPHFATKRIDPARRSWVDISLRPDVITGRVTGSQGAALHGVSVTAGDARTTTAKDGTFRLEGIPDGGNIAFKSSGFQAKLEPIEDKSHVEVALERFNAKAVYMTPATAGAADSRDQVIDLIDRTELNAVVVDVKDSSGHVFYDTKVQLAHDIGAVQPAYEVKPLLDLLHQHQIYVIGRIVVFEDPILAEARPEWAIHDASDGGLWRTWNGLAWVNAHRTEVWDYDIALATEAANLGFDEIQLDYIRFPTDGPLDRAEYGVPHNSETRPVTIRDFLNQAHDALAPTSAYLGADIFGLVMWNDQDSGIGQQLEDVANAVDYVCPMVYPSHFSTGSLGFDIPNDHPYEVILQSMQQGTQRIPQYVAKLRPWLQDFSLGAGIQYGDDEVRKQIQASDDFGTSGWMLWNAANVYHEGALNPQ